ncbi:MAG: DNA mismatch repair protein MutS [Eubacteriales bacterium]|nr:DNA mismatch repair protein MutS [Eubacteriales bacterium]
MAQLSPMMQHYLKTKHENPDCLLFYRLGDFYEMFFDDAVTVSRELELTLTGKSCGLPERAPMCGVPYHAVDGYLTRLVENGHKVAVCEQMEDPRAAKGIVRREVVRIVTPGTNLDMNALEEGRNNYILCAFYCSGQIGIAAADISTGDFLVSEVSDTAKLYDEIVSYSPAELVCNEALLMSRLDLSDLRDRLSIQISTVSGSFFEEASAVKLLLEHFRTSSLMSLGLEDFPSGTAAAGALLRYLYDTQKNALSNLTRIRAYASGRYMLLDSSTRRNLELTRTLRDKKKHGSLLWVLDKTCTAMGARLLRLFLEQPLTGRKEIEERLDCVQALCERSVDRDELREYLRAIYDLERLMTRISYQSANPRDLIALRNSLRMFEPIRTLLSGFEENTSAEPPSGSAALEAGILRLRDEIEDFRDLLDLLERAVTEEPPVTIREGGIIKTGFDPDIDRLRDARDHGRQWLMDLESRERERTGIKNLRVKYNKVFGYYFEVTNSFKDLVPEDYVRKQTLVGSERYTTQRLKELEDSILNAEDKLNTLEYDSFCSVREACAARIRSFQKAAKALAHLDVYASLSLTAERGRYVRPSFNESGTIRITNGRHPVVEQMQRGDFIPNDTLLDGKKNCICIITGPNMAGKSTYMRQVALIALMAQIGSFVPADKARLCVTDRIFTRVGASDDLGSGQSTFMVEMNEVSNILRNATSKSLLILDEIGRGTSTYDGMSIAWAVVEHISNRRYLGAKTLFATHYHELTELEGKIPGVKNYCVAVRESGDNIIFLRKIVRGGADKSYGIQVARLAGLPDIVIDRAMELVAQLTDNDITEKLQSLDAAGPVDSKPRASVKPVHYDDVDLAQMSLFETTTDADVLRELAQIDIPNLTPLDALNTLYLLQSRIKNRWSGS